MSPGTGVVQAVLNSRTKYLTKASAPSAVFWRAAAGMVEVSVGVGLGEEAEEVGEDDEAVALGVVVALGVGSAADSQPPSSRRGAPNSPRRSVQRSLMQAIRPARAPTASTTRWCLRCSRS